MLGCRVFVFHVERKRMVLGAGAPGLGWESVLVQAIRQYYADTTQGRWVKVLGTERVEKNRRYERWAVLTSRDEVLSVVVREQSTMTDAEDPPEVIDAVVRRAMALAVGLEAIASA